MRSLHEWNLSYKQAVELQKKLADKVKFTSLKIKPNFIAGIDCAFTKDKQKIIGCVVVLKYPELEVVETKHAVKKVTFPYIPGLLSFREAPVCLAAIEKLKTTTKLFLDLPDDTELPNGWSKRELGIHLKGWDEELIKIAEHLKKGKAFIWEEFCPEEADVYNSRFLEQNKGVSKAEILSSFEKTRSVILKVYDS